jgi:hypothetical protein
MFLLPSESDHWTPSHARPHWEPPEVDMLIGYDYRPWQVMAVRDIPHADWTQEHRDHVDTWGAHHRPVYVRLRPAGHESPDPVAAKAHDITVSGIANSSTWYVLPEHYVICACCEELPPCREEWGRRVAAREIREMGTFENAGVCPACQEVISQRQRSITFSENLALPGGPPVTFHLRGRCRWRAEQYEKRWVDADPKRRRTALVCSGRATVHNDGTYDCTEFGECRGPRASHPDGIDRCRCRDCHAKGTFSWELRPTAVRNARLRGT